MVSIHVLLRRLSAFVLLGGLAHVLIPERLLATAEWGYDRVLAVDFAPRPAAPRRVRLVGVLLIGGATLALRLLSRRSHR